jgi:uncharacterized membrane protein
MSYWGIYIFILFFIGFIGMLIEWQKERWRKKRAIGKGKPLYQSVLIFVATFFAIVIVSNYLEAKGWLPKGR